MTRLRVVLVVLLVALLAKLAWADGDTPKVHTVPASIPADCSRDVQTQLSRFIKDVPDGSTVRFPRNGCYAQRNRIEVREKTDLIIDGNGSTFKSSAENTGRIVAPNWMLLRVRRVRITNMTVVGNFHLKGRRSQQRVNEHETPPYTGAQGNAGISVYGGEGVWITDMKVRNVFGDAVLTGMSEYVEKRPPYETPRNVHVQRVDGSTTARHCFSPNQVIGFWLEDSSGRDCWYGAVDAELDTPEQSIRNVHFLGNTFEDFLMFGIFIPVAGNDHNTRDIEIRHNRFLTRPDNACNQTILVGAYAASNPNTFKNVVVEDNEMVAAGTAIQMDHVVGGSVRRNLIEEQKAGCPTPRTKVTNSSNVVVADNGPDATPAPGGRRPALVPRDGR